MNIKLTARKLLLVLSASSVFALICVCLFRISLWGVVITLLVVLLYHISMTVSATGMKQIKEYEVMQANTELIEASQTKVLLSCLITLSPIYLLIFLISTIPIFTKEAWFVTVFPCLAIGSIVMISVMDKYRELTKKRWPLLLSYVGIVLALMLLGMAVPSLLT